MQKDFDWTIAPVTKEEFFRDYFEKKHLVIKRGQADYYSDLLSTAEIDTAVSTFGLSAPEVNVVQADKEINTSHFSYENGFIDSIAVNQLFADGATIIMSGLQERIPKLANFCRSLESAFSARVQTNTYLTPANSQGFKAHYDGHDVLVLQVEGTKEWRIYDTPVELPLQSQGFNPHDIPIGEETDRFVLEPGDMAYVPRGLTHDAVATDQTSLHITTGLMVRSWADLMVEAVTMLSHHDVDFREALPPGFANDEFDNATMQEKFARLLGKVNRAALDPVLNHFREDFISTRVPRAHSQMAQIARLDTLNGTSNLAARPNLIYRLNDIPSKSGGEDQVAVSCQGLIFNMPAFVKEPLGYALSSPHFTLADLPGELDDSGRETLIRRLVREGMVMFLDD